MVDHIHQNQQKSLIKQIKIFLRRFKMNKIIVISLTVLVAGCTTTPVPEIKIVTEGDVTVTVINGNDKATLGDDAAINDADSGLANPTLGLN